MLHNATFDSSTALNDNGHACGGAIFSFNSEITIEDSIFRSCWALSNSKRSVLIQGGALFAVSSVVKITTTKFESCLATHSSLSLAEGSDLSSFLFGWGESTVKSMHSRMYVVGNYVFMYVGQ